MPLKELRAELSKDVLDEINILETGPWIFGKGIC
jgi:hypothetical protein